MDKDLTKQIGRSLQKLRQDAGFRSAEAFVVKVSERKGTYTGYKQGKHALSLEKAWLFADELKCTLDELIGRDFPRPTFQDSRQERLNGCYESLNEESKTRVSDMMKSIAANPRRRIVEGAQKGLDGDTNVGGVA